MSRAFPLSTVARRDLAKRMLARFVGTLGNAKSLEFTWDEDRFADLLDALCEGIPELLTETPSLMDKEERQRFLMIIDGIDRFVRRGGAKTTREVLTVLVSMIDLMDQMVDALKIEVRENGEDVTERVFSGR